jgi:hypothetical protein
VVSKSRLKARAEVASDMAYAPKTQRQRSLNANYALIIVYNNILSNIFSV